MNGPPSNTASPPARRSWPRRLLNRLEIGQAVFFGVLLRLWQLLAGFVTLFMISQFFPKPVQGMYFAFASVVAIQTFFELGFGILIINQCSHEWAQLRLQPDGTIGGDPDAHSRLVSFGRLIFRWYGIASLLFVLTTTTFGSAFLAANADADMNWAAPWIGVAIMSGLLLWALPFNAFLEGCNQVAEVNRFRLVQAMTANISVWLVMGCGGGLWAAAAASAARVVCDLVFLLVWYRRFFESFWRPPVAAVVSWARDIWPLQWKLAVGAVFGYFGYFLFVPVILNYQGLAAAGQMGATWTVVTAIQAAALGWVQTRAPLFGMLVSQGDRSELDRVFFRVTSLGIAAYLLAASTFWSLLWLINEWQFEIADRLLGTTASAAFLAAALVQIITSSFAFYVRAHKQEPFLWVGVISNVAIGLSVWQLGARLGPLGAGLGLLGCNLLITLPTHLVLWKICRDGAAHTDRAGQEQEAPLQH